MALLFSENLIWNSYYILCFTMKYLFEFYFFIRRAKEILLYSFELSLLNYDFFLKYYFLINFVIPPFAVFSK